MATDFRYAADSLHNGDASDQDPIGQAFRKARNASTNRTTSESLAATIEMTSPDTVRPFRVPAIQYFATTGVVECEIEREDNRG